MKLSDYLFNVFWEYFNDDLLRKCDIVVKEKCKSFIKNYLVFFENDFNNEKNVMFFSLTQNEIELLRVLFSSCNDYVVNSGNKIVQKFMRNMYHDLNDQLRVFLVSIEHPDEIPLKEIEKYIGVRSYRFFSRKGFLTVQDLTRLSICEIESIPGVGSNMIGELIGAVHLLGLNFKEEVINNLIQDENGFDKIHLVQKKKQLEKYKVQLASLKFQESLIEKEIKQLEIEVAQLDDYNLLKRK
jgi:hypothetical protein